MIASSLSSSLRMCFSKTIIQQQQQQHLVRPFVAAHLSSFAPKSQVTAAEHQQQKQKHRHDHHRYFSNRCEPARRFRNALEEYRRINYSRETPTRFKKEILKVLLQQNQQSMINKNDATTYYNHNAVGNTSTSTDSVNVEDYDSNSVVQVDSLNRLLINIGRSKDVFTGEELDILLKESGNSYDVVVTDNGIVTDTAVSTTTITNIRVETRENSDMNVSNNINNYNRSIPVAKILQLM